MVQLLWLQTATTDLQRAVEDQAAAQVLCYHCTSTRISVFRIVIGVIRSSEHVAQNSFQFQKCRELVITEHN